MGEVTAAVVAGALSPADGLRVIATRSRLMSRLAGQGAMALLELDPESAEALIADYPDVTLAVYASPRQTVIAGPPEQVDAVIAVVDAQDRLARRIEVDVASHHPIIDPILPELRTALADLTPQPPRIPVITTTHDHTISGAIVFDAEYWVANLRNPVRFSQAIATAGAEHATFVEISPHPLLTYAISDTLGRAHHHSVGNPAARHPRHADLPHQPQHHPHHPPADNRAPARATSGPAHHPLAPHTALDHVQEAGARGRICAQIRHPPRRAHCGRQHTARTPVAGATGAGGQAVSGFPSNPRRGSGADIGSATDPFGSSCRMWRIDIV